MQILKIKEQKAHNVKAHFIKKGNYHSESAEAMRSYDFDSLAGNGMERAFENCEKSLPKTAKFLMSAI